MEEEKIIESDISDRMTAPLEVPEEQMLHRLISFQTDLEVLAEQFAFAENLTEAQGVDVDKRARAAEAGADVMALKALIRRSLNSSEGRSDIAPVLALIAVISEKMEGLSDTYEEKRQEGADIPEKHSNYLAEKNWQLHRLFNMSLGMKRFSDTDAEDLSLWATNEAHQLEETAKRDADDPKRKSFESAIRGSLPVFQRFRDGQETKNDLDLLLGEIENKRHSELNELKEMLIAYARSSDETARIHMNEYLEKVVMLRHFDRMIRRKQLGE